MAETEGLNLYNFEAERWEEYDHGTGGDLSVTEAMAYLPPEPSVRGIFLCRVGLGDTVLEAMTKALEAYVIPRSGQDGF